MKRNVSYTTLIPVVMLVGVFVYLLNKPPTSLKGERKIQDITKNCPIPKLSNRNQYLEAVHTLETNCINVKIFGGPPRGQIDSDKRICFDDRFKIIPGKCNVFSFGVNNDFSFEDQFAEYGCKVFSFDPTMDVADHKHSENVWFYAVGISNFTGMKRIGMGKNWKDRKVDRFENLVNMVGLTGNPIDVVKLDVELSEIDFFHDMLFHSRHVLENIKLLAVELHADTLVKKKLSGYELFWPYLHYLRCAGFKLISSEQGPRWTEVVWAQEKQW